ncbi:hypothetical protein [Limimaricola hongkongensis]|uniref:Lipoprotein n=1 Tax=Limimaricola hongkongensis DSM 17492 TaxID=1122180 RepID=A0A017HH76_9RHOB|nr:hypothetical protein [Limimaricola hongkongensis]EYD73665.1 hypothetical protein Lokhon_00218 [Limimaricola hongkongensis DSM 17492]
MQIRTFAPAALAALLLAACNAPMDTRITGDAPDATSRLNDEDRADYRPGGDPVLSTDGFVGDDDDD